jgi:SRSO17 transposase
MSKTERGLAEESEKRFVGFIDRIGRIIGKGTERLYDYCSALCLDVGERKSMEPIAATTAPDRVSAQHQSIHHFVSKSAWDDEAVLAEVRDYTIPAITKYAPIAAWIVDDTGIPKKGKHSVGVGHQYCGQLGKRANCQVAVTLSVANEHASLPIAYRLYLPEDWLGDVERCEYAGIPTEIPFETKPHIALKQIRVALDAGVPQGTLICDAGYGNDAAFRDQLTEWSVPYAVAVQGTTTVWPAEGTPLVPVTPSQNATKRPKKDQYPQPMSVKALAMQLPKKCYRTIELREGTKETMRSRFAAVRVRAANGNLDRDEEWLLVEWPLDKEEPERYWLSTLPRSTTMKKLVQTVQLRWRIERDFQELKSEFGLNHFEGRNWRGFHHHATLCIATYAFLAAERASFSPSARMAFAASCVPRDYRRRGTPHHRSKT